LKIQDRLGRVSIEIEATLNLSIGIQVNDCNVPKAEVELVFLNDGYVPIADFNGWIFRHVTLRVFRRPPT
jgi:hypothetical protein